MKNLSAAAAAVILAFSGAPAFAQNTLSAPMIEGAGPIESGPAVSTASTTNRAQITTPTAPEVAPPPVLGPSPVTTPLNTAPRPPQIPGDAASVRQIQQQLNQQGFRTSVNGIWDAQTRTSLQNFQRMRGLNVNGSLDQRTVAALGITASPPSLGTNAANPSGVGSNPNAFPNPSGVGGTPNSFPNPSGVGGTPNSIPNPAGVGGGSNIGVGGQANISAPSAGANAAVGASGGARGAAR